MSDPYTDFDMLVRTQEDIRHIHDLMAAPCREMGDVDGASMGVFKLAKRMDDFGDEWSYGIKQLSKFWTTSWPAGWRSRSPRRMGSGDGLRSAGLAIGEGLRHCVWALEGRARVSEEKDLACCPRAVVGRLTDEAEPPKRRDRSRDDQRDEVMAGPARLDRLERRLPAPRFYAGTIVLAFLDGAMISWISSRWLMLPGLAVALGLLWLISLHTGQRLALTLIFFSLPPCSSHSACS
ncbi:hypothetical protein ACWGKA_00265 [Streptomyces luteogriseus]